MIQRAFRSSQLVESYAPKAVTRNWGAEEFLEGGLQKHIDEGLAVKYGPAVSGYLITTMPPEALAESYNHTLFALPEYGSTAVGTIHELPIKAAKALHEFMFQSVASIRTQSQEDGEEVNIIYVNQHIGPKEVNGHPFNSSLLPLHYHVFSYDEAGIGRKPHAFKEVNLDEIDRDSTKHLLRDPLFPLIEDIARAELEPLGVDLSVYKARSSLAISGLGKATDPFTEREVILIREISEIWDTKSREIASLFTNGELDDISHRPKLYSKDQIISNIEDYLSIHEGLGEKSVRLLRYLAYNAQEAADVDLWSWFFNGQAGAMSWEFDFTQNQKRIILAPRTQVTKMKNWLILPEGASHIVLKNKRSSPSPEDKKRTLDSQRRLNSRLASIAMSKDAGNDHMRQPDIKSNQGSIWIDPGAVIKVFRSREEYETEVDILEWLGTNYGELAPKILSKKDDIMKVVLEDVGVDWFEAEITDLTRLVRLLTPLWTAENSHEFPFKLLGTDLAVLKRQLFVEQVLKDVGDIGLRTQARNAYESVMQKLIAKDVGIVHMDISPNNICINAAGKTTVIDWSRAACSYPLIDIAHMLETFELRTLPDGTIPMDPDLAREIADLPFVTSQEDWDIIKCLMLAFDVKKGITARTKKSRNKVPYTQHQVVDKLETMIGIAER